MKKIITCILITTLVVSFVFADQTLYTPEGKAVLLRDNGTYEFVEQTEQVRIILQSIKSDISYDKEELTVLTFNVENLGFGTIYYLYAPVKAYDDRGKEYKDYADSAINTRDWDTVYIEKNSSKTFTVKVRGDVDFLQKVIIGKIKPENFNMRELPNKIEFNKLIKVESSIPNVIIEKEN